jgi:predicted histidine transporter YuiF (NhaC family)
MTTYNENFKPATHKKILIIIAGAMWCCVGIMLTVMAVKWLHMYKGNIWVFAIPGFITALFIHRFGFLKIVDKNLRRISELPEHPCVFSFISWKSYLIIGIMVTMGITLRHSPIPKQYLSVIYLGIGMALFLSSMRYFRNLFGYN